MEIPKEYFTLEEVLRRWKIPETDLRYLAETDQLRLSVVVFNRHLELGCHEEIDKGRFARVHGTMGGLRGFWTFTPKTYMRFSAMAVGVFQSFDMQMPITAG